MGLRLLLMGTGEFALPAFQKLMESGHPIAGLVTQPDRTGKGHHQHVNPLKELALQRSVPVLQPAQVNAPESLDELRRLNADLFVVAAYGQILSADLLSIPRLGAINLHGSLLPKYRGAAPVQYAVWKGEAESGVTIFQIEPRLDAGPMLARISTPIGPKETSGQLHDRLAKLAVPATVQVIHQLEQGITQPLLQTGSEVTRAPRLKKEAGEIRWNETSREVDCRIRAMQPWPMPYTFLHLPGRKPQRLLVLDVDLVDTTSSDTLVATSPSGTQVVTKTERGQPAGRPGDLLVTQNQLLVRTGNGVVKINTLQPAGKRIMPAEDFLRGTPVTGGRFGSETEQETPASS